VLYDAVSLAATDRLSKEVGRKVIVLITDGVDQGSTYTIKRAIEDAQKADSVIYSIYYVDPSAYMGRGGFSFGGGGEGYLKQMSEETGGRVFKVDRGHTLQDAFNQLQDEMRSQYAIGWTPANERKDGSYHKLEFKLTDKNLKVQARKGYYAVPPPQ
jgi:VWFA-related protein